LGSGVFRVVARRRLGMPQAAKGTDSVSTVATGPLGVQRLREVVSAVRRRWSVCDIRISGKTASATARTMRGMLIMKSAIDFVGTVGSGFLLLEAHGDGQRYSGSQKPLSGS